ncbi:MAG: hypothetical protein WCI39_07595 [Gallionellaceae bacterium]
MAHSNFYAVNEVEFAENIEKRFNEYVALFIQLHYPEGGQALSEEERRELSAKVKAAVNEITLLGMKRKRIKSVADVATGQAHLAASAADPIYQPALN